VKTVVAPRILFAETETETETETEAFIRSSIPQFAKRIARKQISGPRTPSAPTTANPLSQNPLCAFAPLRLRVYFLSRAVQYGGRRVPIGVLA
jgi:hypothetical protein